MKSLASPEPVRILCAANAAFAPALCVMLVSLLANLAKDRKVEIYAIATNIPEEDRRKIEASLCENRLHFDLGSLHWLSPSLDLIQGLFIDKWMQIETYARLLAPHILPQEIDKILYLDSDMVVLSDISTLYDSPCDDHAVLAAKDGTVVNVASPSGVFNYAELGIPPATPYFNAGVLLINLRRWRERNIADKVIAYLKLHRGSVYCWDQGGLNAVLYDSWTEIDPAWNQMHYILDPSRREEIGFSPTEWNRVKNHTKIVHYSGEDKPWNKNNLPRYSYFFKYLAKTKYRDTFKGPWLEHLIGFRLNFIIWSRNNNSLSLLIRPIKAMLSFARKPLQK